MLSTLSLDDITKSIMVILSAEQGWNPSTPRSKSSQEPLSTVAFHHFIKCSADTIATPAIRDVMKTDVIRVAFNVSFVTSFQAKYLTICHGQPGNTN